MQEALDRPALQLEALGLGLARPGLCTHSTDLSWPSLPRGPPLSSSEDTGVGNATGVCCLARSALTHILVWRESGVDTTHSSSLGPEGMGMQR